MNYEDSIYPLEEVILAPVQKTMDDFNYVNVIDNVDSVDTVNNVNENYKRKSFVDLTNLQFKSIFYYICYYCLI